MPPAKRIKITRAPPAKRSKITRAPPTTEKSVHDNSPGGKIGEEEEVLRLWRFTVSFFPFRNFLKPLLTVITVPARTGLWKLPPQTFYSQGVHPLWGGGASVQGAKPPGARRVGAGSRGGAPGIF